MNDEQEKRPEYYAKQVSVLNCTPGNFDYATGEPATVITLGSLRDGSVNPLAINMRDARMLAVKVLVALATNGDHFARKVLDDLFPTNADGEFFWPDSDVLPDNEGI